MSGYGGSSLGSFFASASRPGRPWASFDEQSPSQARTRSADWYILPIMQTWTVFFFFIFIELFSHCALLIGHDKDELRYLWFMYIASIQHSPLSGRVCLNNGKAS